VLGQGGRQKPSRIEIKPGFSYNTLMRRPHTGLAKFISTPHLYVFIFSLYPIIFLYQQNISEVAFSKTIPPMLISLVLTAILWLGLGFIYADKEKRAVVIFMILLVIFYYKLIRDVLHEILQSTLRSAAPLFTHLFLFASLTLALFLIRRSKRSFLNVGKILSAIIFVLLAWNLGTIILYHTRNTGAHTARQLLQKNEFQKPLSTANKPDIYCIFLDEFASLESVKKLFHYDNSKFAERLRNAGFFIAEKSRCLHVLTSYAIASVLNMENIPAKSDAQALVQQNKVARFLNENGYEIYDFPFRGLAIQELAREHYFYPLTGVSIFFDDFYKMLADMSILYPLAENWQNDEGKYSSYFRKHALYIFEQVPAIVKKPGPKFVLVHLYSPHAPFVFDKNGEAVAPKHSLDYSERKYYLEQYLYISRRAAEMAEAILRESATPPVIIIQSDHGYRGSFRKPLLHVVPLEEKRKVFLSLYLPGCPYSQLDTALSPINVFRILLNHYFGQKLPLK
jgi:hypothetical protein